MLFHWRRRRFLCCFCNGRRTSRTVALERLDHSAFDASVGPKDGAVDGGDRLAARPAALDLALAHWRDGHQFDVSLLLRFGLRAQSHEMLRSEAQIEC